MQTATPTPPTSAPRPNIARSAAFVSQPAYHERFVRSLWDSLRGMHPELPASVPEGITVTTIADGRVTTARSTSESYFACEVLLLTEGDAYELYHVPFQGDAARAGWRRQGLRCDVVPDVWSTAAAQAPGVLGSRVTPRIEPEFALLAAQLCATGESTVTSFDAEGRRALEEEARHFRETAAHQSEVIRQLRLAAMHARVTPVSPITPENGASSPESDDALPPELRLRDLADWAAENTDRIIVLGRAVSEAKKSDYQDDALAYAALEFLAGPYRQARLGELNATQLRDAHETLGLTLSGSMTPTAAGSHRDDYFFSWGGRRRFLDFHVGRGNSRDSRFCLRVYFTWDAEEGKVIVGWLPTHLDTSAT
jgi:hypothetical protein